MKNTQYELLKATFDYIKEAASLYILLLFLVSLSEFFCSEEVPWTRGRECPTGNIGRIAADFWLRHLRMEPVKWRRVGHSKVMRGLLRSNNSTGATQERRILFK